MRGAVVVLLLGLAGCGRYGYAIADGDAGAADAPAADAEPLGPFTDVEPIAELADSTAGDDDPSLTGDLRELYFKSNRGGMNDFDIWVARRDDAEAPWQDPVEVAELSSTKFDATPEVSLDGLSITLSSDRPGGGGGGIDLWISTRLTRDDPWEPPVPIAELNSAAEEYAAVTDESGGLVIFNRGVPGHSFDLFQSTRDGAIWSLPAALVNLSSVSYEADSHLDPAGGELYFAGELPDAMGRDIYVATRGTAGDDFAVPERVVELSSPTADEDPWVSPDRRLIVFSSDRSGDQELYWATR